MCRLHHNDDDDRCRRLLPQRIRDNAEDNDGGERIRKAYTRMKGRSRPPMALTMGVLWCVVAWMSLTVCGQANSSLAPTDEPTSLPGEFTDTPSFTLSPEGTVIPTLSPAPTPPLGPTDSPSSIPSDLPSDMPSLSPTPEATFAEPIVATARFRQDFSVANGRLFNPFEQTLFEGLYASYTAQFPPSGINGGEDRISTQCEFLLQQFVVREPARHRHKYRKHNIRRAARQLQLDPLTTFIQVDFNMAYASNFTNVSTFPLLFQSYVNTDLAMVTSQMRILGLNVSEAFLASRIIVRPDATVAPTITPNPTTLAPTVSRAPTGIPSDMPSITPTSSASPPTGDPTVRPTPRPSEQGPTGPNSGALIIAVSIVVAISIVLVGLLVYYNRKRRLVRELEFQRALANQKNQRDENDWDGNGQTPDNNIYGEEGHFLGNTNTNGGTKLGALGASNGAAADMRGAVLSPSDSLLSNRSLLSTGNSINGDSGDEVDATHHLADEFDQYKDQNLEKMRAGVEGNLTGFDGMMSQALTRALIDEDDTTTDPTELLWGGSGNLIGIEIEASALGEVTDWLKRKETPSDEERRLFMQETLNKMVASVRHGVLVPEEASRSIHECAALLGLQLATEIPVTTLIITGMRKTVTAGDMIDAFSEFGEISEAAVASNNRGFGILRFQANKSVDLAMKRFRKEEIVVQDVAVQVKVLRPGSKNLSADEDDGPLLSGGGPDVRS